MMFMGQHIFNRSFEIFAHNYHSVRPGYPPQLFADLKRLCDIQESSRLLEIGAGSGIATRELAKFGCDVVAIEPGEKLAELARRETDEYPRVTVVRETFESYSSTQAFDGILAFTAYHWIDEGIKDKKVDDLLKEDGTLVLAWNSFFLSDTAVTAAVNGAYHTLLPDAYPNESTVAEVNEGVLAKLQRREQDVVQKRPLYTVALQKYYSLYSYDDVTYPKLLNTFPKVVEIDDERKDPFLKAVGDIVRSHAGITVPVLTTLIVCRKRQGFLRTISLTDA